MTDLAERERLSRELADGPLRDEMFPELVAQERAARQAERPPAQEASTPGYRLRFTGDGREYFRIWIVNLLLTLATLGIYSAWAKVRKTRYFWQNTRLEGHVFDYHGAPLAILRGRILAVVLFAAYSWAFDISRVVGLVTIGVLCVSGPWLFWKAQQFKFRNSSHRGVHFDFISGARDAYVSLLPLLLIWAATAVSGVLLVEKGWLALTVGLSWLALFPWMHQRLKNYQHSRARYGDQQARFQAATADFYWTYAKGVFVLLGALLAAIVVGAAFTALFYVVVKDPQYLRKGGWIAGLAVAGAMYACLWPYFSARLQRIVWNKTQLGPLRFRTTMAAGALFGLVVACVFWTTITLGLYWPFAAIRLARYRIESMEVLSNQPLDQIARGVIPSSAAAAGDSAADLFGLDIGL